MTSQAVQQGQRESGRLSSPRLRTAQHVAPLEHKRDRLRLNGCRVRVSLLGNRLEKLGQEIQISKTGQTMGLKMRNRYEL